jgi:CHC2 zinc finger
MSGPPRDRLAMTNTYVRMLSSSAQPGTLLDVRYRTVGRRFAQCFFAVDDPDAAQRIATIGQRTDVYVGCAPRTRRRGTREDIAATALLWADCDSRAALAALEEFDPPPSMIVASGTPDHVHAYWMLTRTLDPDEVEDANRRLALALGADVKCADPTRILRPPGTLSFKHDPPRAVQLVHHSEARYVPATILADLPRSSPEREPRIKRRNHGQSPAREHDPLQQIKPAAYVRLLAGVDPGRDGKVACPFHHEDNTPSLHVYPTPEQGWACYGCPSLDGKPVGGDIYTFASMLWSIPARGASFNDLRERLHDVFGIYRDLHGALTVSRATHPSAATTREQSIGAFHDRAGRGWGDDRVDGAFER